MAALWAVILNPCYLQLNLILPDTRPKTFPINVSTNWVLCTITAKIIPIINHLWFLVLFCLERISQLHSYFGPDNSLLCEVVLYIVGCFSIVFVLYLPDASNNSLVMTIKMKSTYLLGVKLLTFKYGKNLETLLQQGNVQLKYDSLIIYYCFQFSQFSPAQSLSCVRLFVTPWIAAHKASRSITNSRSSLKLMSIESVMPSSHLILCYALLHLPPIPPSIRVFSNESTLCMRWPKYWSFSLSISPSKEHLGLVCFRMDWLDLHAV